MYDLEVEGSETKLTLHEAAAALNEIGVVEGSIGHCVDEGEGEAEVEVFARPRKIVPSSCACPVTKRPKMIDMIAFILYCEC